MDRIASTTLGSATTTYLYDGTGTRMQASTGTQASKKTNDDWDPNGALPQLVAERDGNAALVRRYCSGLDTVTLDTGGSPFYYHHDGLGSVVNLTSSTGVAQWTYDYLPYGDVRTATKNQNQAPANVLRYTGELLDPTGLYHLRARQYDSGTGRFLGVDSALAQVAEPYLSTYGYGLNNPVLNTDPSGLDTFGLCFGGQAVGGVGGSVQVCLIATTDLEVGVTVTPAGLAGSPGVSVNGSVQHSDGESINDLGQWFDVGGGSAGEGVGLGFEVFSGSGRCGQSVVGQTASAQATLKGPPIEGHTGRSYTFIPLNVDFGGIFGDKDAPCAISSVK